MKNETAEALVYASATAAAEAIKRKETTSVGVLEAVLARISETNPRVNAIITMDAERALEQARKADEEVDRFLSGRSEREPGPLHGVPVTVKDNVATAGMRTTAGHPPLKNNVPAEDAAVVERLRKAGAIILGKTNMSELAMDLQTVNPLFGRTSNPWDLSRTPGGSSGGEGAAVASGMSYLGVGNDLLVSVRLPAHYCGLFSYLPTSGLVPLSGFTPGGPESGFEKHVLRHGFLARAAADLRTALLATAGPHPGEPWLVPFPLRTGSAGTRGEGIRSGGFGGLESVRFAVCMKAGDIPVSGDTERVMNAFVRNLEAEGARVKTLETDFSDHRKAVALWSGFMSRLMGSMLPPPVRFLAGLSNRGLNPSLRDYLELERARYGLVSEIDRVFDDADILLTPVSSTPAFPHLEPLKERGTMKTYGSIDVDGAALPYAAATGAFGFRFALSGHPTATVPSGFSAGGLPIGVQAVGRRWDDERFLSVLEAMDGRVARFTAPPL